MIHRGDVVDADFAIGGRHPAVVVTREQAIPVLSSVAVVLVTRTVRGHPAEVVLGGRPGLDLSRASVANCDDIATLPKARLGRYRGRLDAEALAELDRALALAWASIAPRPELYRAGRVNSWRSISSDACSKRRLERTPHRIAAITLPPMTPGGDMC